MKTRDRWISGVFLFGVAVALYGQPTTTYSWMWNEVKDVGHEFSVGLLDISHSYFGNQWTVIEGGNQAINLSKMIPGDARRLEATLSKGSSDLDFLYKIVATVEDGAKQGSAEKLAAVLRIRVERSGEVIFDGPIQQLSPVEGTVAPKNTTEDSMSKNDADKKFVITVYVPEKGLDASFQGLNAQVSIRFLAKQATSNAVYGG
ncbi:hypothetical protein ACQCN2_22105 [Brevibacillus ginsengisoli]|uniref:hypothetical protein n=1 Tax=Brevibacillus ginsengisoli TaxID=363854 RepID=UPI003CF7CF0D